MAASSRVAAAKARIDAQRKAARAKPKSKSEKKAAKKKVPGKKGAKKKDAKTPDAVLPPAFVDAQWKPGQSGNPAGRPKKKSFEEVMKDYLEGQLPNDAQGRTRLEAMVAIVFSEGVTKRNAKVMIALLDRLYPKSLKLVGDPENPLTIAPTEPDLSQCTDKEVKAIIAARKILKRVSSPES